MEAEPIELIYNNIIIANIIIAKSAPLKPFLSSKLSLYCFVLFCFGTNKEYYNLLWQIGIEFWKL